MTPAEKFHRGSRAAFGLLALLMAWLLLETLLKPLSPGAMLVLATVLLLPLAAFLRPLWRGNADGALWLSMVLMPYLCWAVLGAFVPGPDGLLALARALLIGACFTALMLMVRWHRASVA